jgi:outer membrane protein OmpA-like peptidoglycan-associated protein
MTRAAVASLLALFLLITVGCLSPDDPDRRTKQGAVIGAATGAAAGAVVGNQSGNPRTGAAVGAVVGGAAGAAIGRRMDQQQRELEQIPGVQVERPSETELNVVLTNDVLFDFDSAALRPESRNALRDMADVFQRYSDTMISVEGHADSTGRAEYNLGLSQRRAQSVADFLSGQGVSRSRIVARGHGDTRPKASNATAEGRQLNRRVEIHVRAVEQAGSM